VNAAESSPTPVSANIQSPELIPCVVVHTCDIAVVPMACSVAAEISSISHASVEAFWRIIIADAAGAGAADRVIVGAVCVVLVSILYAT
jgi:hypothetical protein